MSACLQAGDTPFGAAEQQEQREGEGPGATAVQGYSTINEVAEDIANNWGKAPQPRKDARRDREEEHGQAHSTFTQTVTSFVCEPAVLAARCHTSQLKCRSEHCKVM